MKPSTVECILDLKGLRTRGKRREERRQIAQRAQQLRRYDLTRRDIAKRLGVSESYLKAAEDELVKCSRVAMVTE